MLSCFYMDISGGCSYEQSLVLSQHLLPERKKRIDRMKNKEMVNKQLLISAFLQYCLSEAMDIYMENVKLLYNKYEKPYVKNNEVYFNLSHSGDYVVLAVSSLDVGIDVEFIREKRLNVAERFFCEDEYRYIMSADDVAIQNKRFLEYWTMKEAFVKCCGAGLAIPLNSFKLTKKDGLYIAQFQTGKTENNEYFGTMEIANLWQYNEIRIKTFDLSERYCIAVCALAEEDLVHMNRNWNQNNNVKKVILNDIFEKIK